MDFSTISGLLKFKLPSKVRLKESNCKASISEEVNVFGGVIGLGVIGGKLGISCVGFSDGGVDLLEPPQLEYNLKG
jgi:hypothetical protein